MSIRSGFLADIRWSVCMSKFRPVVNQIGKFQCKASSFFSFLFFFLFFSFWLKVGLAWFRWSICITKSQRLLSVSFSRTDSRLCMYHLSAWSNLNFLHNSQWTTLLLLLLLYSLKLYHTSVRWWSFSGVWETAFPYVYGIFSLFWRTQKWWFHIDYFTSSDFKFLLSFPQAFKDPSECFDELLGPGLPGGVLPLHHLQRVVRCIELCPQVLNRPDLHFEGAGKGPVVITWIGRDSELYRGTSPISLGEHCITFRHDRRLLSLLGFVHNWPNSRWSATKKEKRFSLNRNGIMSSFLGWQFYRSTPYIYLLTLIYTHTHARTRVYL